MDGNAWDLVEETDDDASRAKISNMDGSFATSSLALSDEDAAADADLRRRSRADGRQYSEPPPGNDNESSTGGALSAFAATSSPRNRRSKSPAVESMRKVSRMLFYKVSDAIGLRRSASATDFGATSAVAYTPTAPQVGELAVIGVPLGDRCRPPAQTHYKGRKRAGDATASLSASTSGKRVVDRDNVLTDRRVTNKEKGSHLFRNDTEQAQLAEAQRLAEQRMERVYKYDPYCPVHGAARRHHRRLIDMHNFVASVEAAPTDADQDQFFTPILSSQAYLAKMLRKRRRAYLSSMERAHVEKAKHKILANLWIVSVAFLFLFTGFHGLQNLQTTVNGQLGADSLAIFYFTSSVSSLFVPSFVLNRLGTKTTLVAAIGVHILYMFANFIPNESCNTRFPVFRYYSLIPASMLAGMAASCLWAAKCVYITESGIRYARLNVEAQNVVIVRFFGYFFMIVHLGQVLGNLLSSWILSNDRPLPVIEDAVDATCGHNFQHYSQPVPNASVSSALSARALRNLAAPAHVAYFSVVGVDLCCAIVALLIVLLFLNALKSDTLALRRAPDDAFFNTKVLRLTLHNMRRVKLLLLIPLTIFNGVEQAFIVGQYTKAYVACGLGVAQIGYVMTSFGVADAICSLVFGPLIKLFGRMPLFVFGGVINILMIMTLMIWPLNPGDRALFNAIAGVWGMADGVWNTQLNGLWVALLGRTSLELAFANYRFCMSFGMAFGFFLIRFTNIYQFLLVAFAFLLVGILGYFIVELYDMFVEYLSDLVKIADEVDYHKKQQKQKRRELEKQQQLLQEEQQRSQLPQDRTGAEQQERTVDSASKDVRSGGAELATTL